jgi:hypothetical protein
MMQSSLPGVACLVEPSNNSGVAASQNASTGRRAQPVRQISLGFK